MNYLTTKLSRTDAQRARAFRETYTEDDFVRDRAAAVAKANNAYDTDRWDLIPGAAIWIIRKGKGVPKTLKVPRREFWPNSIPPGWEEAA